VLSPFVDANIMEIVDIRGAYAFENKQNVLTLNDCMYRLRSAARWVLFMDFDELLYIAPPLAPPPEPEADEEGEYTPSGRKRRKKRKRHAKPKPVDIAAGSLYNILMQHNGSAFITFGSVWWSVEYCRPPTPALALPIQRMRFHWPHVYCVGEKDMGYSPNHCLNFYGHRKFLVDPRQVWAVMPSSLLLSCSFALSRSRFSGCGSIGRMCSFSREGHGVFTNTLPQLLRPSEVPG
ncbi:unnamed protein product, partial [Closterium sp. NIES-54]